jgi:hypothetical protein
MSNKADVIVIGGPNAVFAFGREVYRKTNFNLHAYRNGILKTQSRPAQNWGKNIRPDV